MLKRARPAGLLMRATELTRSHVRSELAMVCGTIATKGWAPLVHTRLGGYQFTADGDALRAHAVGVVRVSSPRSAG